MWEIFKHKKVNSGTVFIVFNHPFGSPKDNFGPLHSPCEWEAALLTWC